VLSAATKGPQWTSSWDQEYVLMSCIQPSPSQIFERLSLTLQGSFLQEYHLLWWFSFSHSASYCSTRASCWLTKSSSHKDFFLHFCNALTLLCIPILPSMHQTLGGFKFSFIFFQSFNAVCTGIEGQSVLSIWWIIWLHHPWDDMQCPQIHIFKRELSC